MALFCLHIGISDINLLKFFSLVHVITCTAGQQLTNALWNFKILFTSSSTVLYRLCYVVIWEFLLYYFTSVCCSFLMYLVWVFCLIPLAFYCSWKLFLLAQNKYVPLSSINLDVAAKLETKKKKKRANEKENKLRTLLYSCNIIFCWTNSYVSHSSFIFASPENKQIHTAIAYFVSDIAHCLRNRLWG